MRIAGMKLLTVAAAVALGLGLAGCGGGGSPTAGGPQPPGQTLEDRQTAQRAAISAAIDAASAAVAGVTDGSTDSEVGAAGAAVRAARDAIAAAADVPAPEKDADTLTVDVLASRLTAATASRTAAMAAADKARRTAMAKLGKDLYEVITTGLSGDQDIEGPAVRSDDPIEVATPSSHGSVLLEPVGPAAVQLDGWTGINYAHTDASTGIENRALLYTTQGEPKTLPFADAGHTIITADGPTKGMVLVETANLGNVMAPAFTHSGQQNHAVPERRDAFYTRGTYDGAPGEYRCVSGCSSTNDDKGSPSALGGTWHFKPDAGAMAIRPDSDYQYFGWWINKNKDGMPTIVRVLEGIRFGSGFRQVEDDDFEDELTGSATYSGLAVGWWAMSNPLDGSGDGGHFTADATLKAKFGAYQGADAVADSGVTGTIDNFRLNDRADDPGWSVELKRAHYVSGDDYIDPVDGGESSTTGTVWTINGNRAPASGIWSAAFFDEQPGNPPDGDGSNVPTTGIGEFASQFSTFGRMAGAFGVNKDD